MQGGPASLALILLESNSSDGSICAINRPHFGKLKSLTVGGCHTLQGISLWTLAHKVLREELRLRKINGLRSAAEEAVEEFDHVAKTLRPGVIERLRQKLWRELQEAQKWSHTC